MTRPPLPRSTLACLAAALLAPASATEAADPAIPTAPDRVETTPVAATTLVTRDLPGAKSQAAGPVSPTTHVTRSQEIASLIGSGTQLSEHGDYVGAESAFRRVLDAADVTPEHTKQALRAVAHMYRRQGALTKAAAIYERYLKEYSDDEHVPDVLLELGRTLRGLGAHRLALAKFYNVINSTLKLSASDFDHYQALAKTAQFEIAETHFEGGDFSTAAKFYSRLALLELAPDDAARVQFQAARAQRLQGDLAGAAVTLRSFIEQRPRDPNVAEARYLLAMTLQEMNRPQEAFAVTLELLQGAQATSADDPKRWAYWQRRTGNHLANHFFEAGDIANAQAIYSGLLELSSDPAWRLPTTYQLGLCLERLGQLDRARAAYQSVVDVAAAKTLPDLAELVRMATWRLEHLTWRERTTQRMTSLLETSTGKPGTRNAPAVAATPSDHAPVASTPGT